MKKILNSPISVVLFIMILTGCQDQVMEVYKASVPVYMSYTDLRSAVKTEGANALKKPGKIYFKDNYIYINEYFKGIHVIDNSNPAAPVNKTFISIPGNVDIAIKDNVLYADSYIDLVALDITNSSNVTELYRIKDVFPYALPVSPLQYIEGLDQTKGVVVDWEIKEIRKEKKDPYPYYPYPMYLEYAKFSDVSPFNRASQGSSGTVGTGGSMARFAIRDNALYVLSGSLIKVLDISNLFQPVTKTNLTNLWGIETIFLYDTHMYIGAQSGMSIFNITNPLTPVFVSTYTHITSCDPVVVEGNYAYVTLRSGVVCRNTLTNQMDVINIADKAHPYLMKSYAMTSPKGLGIDNQTLFICDGSAGLKVYNASDVMQIDKNLLTTFKDIQATDVIPYNGILFMTGDDGLYEYDYSNLTNIKLLSKIEVKSE